MAMKLWPNRPPTLKAKYEKHIKNFIGSIIDDFMVKY